MPQSLESIESEVAEVYISTFGRAPDKDGLAYWVGEVVKGNLSVEDVSQSFFDQKETQDLYGDKSNLDFIISVYENTLGRTVDSTDAGVQYWQNELDNGVFSQDVFIKAIINGAKAETGDANDAALLQNKVNTGLLYAKEIGMGDAALAREIMEDVTYDATTAENAMAMIDYYDGWVAEYKTALGDGADISEEDMWNNLGDATFWEGIEQNYTLNFDQAPTVQFWDVTESFWNDDADTVENFDFLADETMWFDPSGFAKFDGGEYAQFDSAKIFEQYASEAATMYQGIIENDMNADIMENMFSEMDEDLYNSIFDDMFGSVDQDYFNNMYMDENGSMDTTKFDGMKGHMFNHMFDDIAGDSDQFGTFFGEFEDDFFIDMYKDADGTIDQTMLAGMEGDMFNNMFDDIAADSDMFGTYFGEFEDDFFIDMYKGADGKIDQSLMAGMEGNMFNNMFDDIAGDSTQFSAYFGEFEDDFFTDMYGGADGAVDSDMFAGMDSSMFDNMFGDKMDDPIFGDMGDYFQDGAFVPVMPIDGGMPTEGTDDPYYSEGGDIYIPDGMDDYLDGYIPADGDDGEAHHDDSSVPTDTYVVPTEPTGVYTPPADMPDMYI